jgi:hypothetical protein
MSLQSIRASAGAAEIINDPATRLPKTALLNLLFIKSSSFKFLGYFVRPLV